MISFSSISSIFSLTVDVMKKNGIPDIDFTRKNPFADTSVYAVHLAVVRERAGDHYDLVVDR
jgi:hypothetical protein